MDMEELHESLGRTINYYTGASCCFGQHCHGWFFKLTSETPFVPS
jgi:hypothetical protein